MGRGVGRAYNCVKLGRIGGGEATDLPGAKHLAGGGGGGVGPGGWCLPSHMKRGSHGDIVRKRA